MRSRMTFLKHPLHPMLVMLPIALFPILLFIDVLQAVFALDAFWTVGFWLSAAAVVTALVAMIPGFVDLRALPDGTHAHKTAVFHMVVGIVLTLLYAAGAWIRWPVGEAPDQFALGAGVDVVGTVAVGLQGWLGGELVYKHHVGVEAPEEGGEPVALEGGAGAPARRPGGAGPRV